jgi:hypothetical protein
MKKIILSVLTVLCIYNANVFSQAFTFQRIDPAVVRETISTDTFAQIKNHGVVHNLTGSSINLNIYIINRYVSPLWDPVGMCDWNLCHGAGDSTFLDVICPPGYDTLYAYFSPHSQPGIGQCTIRITYQSTTIDQDFGVAADPIGIQPISTIAKEFSLGQNYPNPFNPNTKINFSLPKNEFAYLRVYDILGREVKTLIAEQLNAGEYQVDFDAKDLASGMYYYSLRAGENVTVKKMVLVK